MGVGDSFLELDEVQALLDKEMGAGVLSVYLDPETTHRHEAPRWQTVVNSGLRTLGQKYPDDRQLQEALETAGKELLGLDPTLRQRSLVYIRSLDPDWRWIENLHGPVGNRFGWGRRAHVLPLMTYFWRQPVVGVVLISQEGFQSYTWRQGHMREGKEWKADWETEHWRRFAAAAYPNPMRGQQTVTHTEHYNRRFLENMRRHLRTLLPEVEKEALAQEWDWIMVFGPAWLRDRFVGALSDTWQEAAIPVPARHLAKVSIRELNQAVEETLTEWLDTLEEELFNALVDMKASGGLVAIGVQEVLDLLNVNRVHRLYLCSDLELSGYRRPKDEILRLYEHPTRQGEWVAEPNLVEETVAKAMLQSAEVVPFSGPASKRLREMGGMAAVLRY